MKFLRYVRANLENSMKDFEDAYVSQLQKSVRKIKSNREMEERFMTLEEMLREEHAEGKTEGKAEGIAESILDVLRESGEVSGELCSRILAETDPLVLRGLLKKAVTAKSVETFEKEVAQL